MKSVTTEKINDLDAKQAALLKSIRRDIKDLCSEVSAQAVMPHKAIALTGR